mgnify:CR=1 FL=1
MTHVEEKWSQSQHHSLLTTYNLDENSIIFDLGGYVGDWSQEMSDKYKCNIYIFEPVKEFYNIIVERFKDNDKVKIFNFGLSDEDILLEISVNKNQSSFYINKTNKLELAKVCNVVTYLCDNVELKDKQIDVMKINIEGSEYPLLLSLLQDPIRTKVKNYQIQFHEFVPNYLDLYLKIQDLFLSNNYNHTYKYPFVWENFQKNNEKSI